MGWPGMGNAVLSAPAAYGVVHSLTDSRDFFFFVPDKRLNSKKELVDMNHYV